MRSHEKRGLVATLIALGLLGWSSVPATAKDTLRIEGQVQAAGGSVAGSTVSLWAATANAPARLAQATTRADGRFVISADQTPRDDASLYLLASRRGRPP